MQFFGLTDIKPEFVRDLIIMALWLSLLAFINRNSQFRIYSIFPYFIPVYLSTWKYGLSWGFIFSGLASWAAIPFNDLWEYGEHNFFWAGMTTYFKLTGLAVGTDYRRRLVNVRRKTK